MKVVHVEHETINFITHSWVYLFSHLRFRILQFDVLGVALDKN